MAQIGNVAQSYLAGLQAPEENEQNKRMVDALIQRANAVFQNQQTFARQSQLQTNKLENQKALQRFKVEHQQGMLSQILGGGGVGGANVPPGTTYNIAGLNIPLNPKLTGDETSAVAAQNVFAPLARDIQQTTRQGVFQSPFGNVGRTYRQFAANQPSALFTAHDPKLQAVQGKLNSIKRYVFGEGGKQLTPYEAKLVFALTNPTGKSDEQYSTDLDQAVAIIEEKSRIALGGQRAAQPVNPFRPSAPAQPSRQIGQIIEIQGRRFRVIDDSDPNDPDVEEV